jgi:phospholipid-transporting ATPase
VVFGGDHNSPAKPSQ